MGFRFSRRVRLSKGFGLNLSGRGVSASHRGSYGSVGTKGISTGTGLPGLVFQYSWGMVGIAPAVFLVAFVISGTLSQALMITAAAFVLVAVPVAIVRLTREEWRPQERPRQHRAPPEVLGPARQVSENVSTALIARDSMMRLKSDQILTFTFGNDPNAWIQIQKTRSTYTANLSYPVDFECTVEHLMEILPSAQSWEISGNVPKEYLTLEIPKASFSAIPRFLALYSERILKVPNGTPATCHIEP